MTDATAHAEHAQRKVERARENLGETIDALKQKMSTSELFDELKSQFMPRGGSEAMSRTMNSLSRQVQENPLALALIGAGVAWLMMGGSSQRSWNGAHRYGDRVGQRLGEYAQGTGTDSGGAMSAGEAMSAGKSAMSSAASSVQGAASSAMSSAQGAMSSARRTASDGASRVADAAREAGQTVSDTASEWQHGLQQTSADTYERYPLVFGAAAVALGAAIGAALPATDFENQQMGEASDKLKDQVAERGSEAVEQARDSAGRVYDAASAEMERQGLTPGSGDSSTRSIGERVEKVGRAAVDKARDEAGKSTANRPGGAPKR